MTDRWFIGCVLALTLVSGCRKPGNTPVPVPESPMPIVLGFNELEMVQTRSQGPLDAWDGQDLYLYAVERRSPDTAAGEKFSDLLLFSKNDPSLGAFVPLKVQAPYASGVSNVQIKKSNGDSFYYPSGTKLDFYGYSIDDASLTDPVQYGDGSLQATVTVSGHQDIFMAKADPAEDCGEKLSPENAYSPMSARLDIHPHLRFRHKLARFLIRVQSVERLQGAFQLFGLKVFSKTQAKMMVVHPAYPVTSPEIFSPVEGSEGWLEVNELPVIDDLTTFGDIMVMPGDSAYIVRLLVKQEGDSEEFYIDVKVDLNKYINKENGQYTAESGYLYKILLTLNGREKVDASVTLQEWENHGEFSLDQDELQRLEDNN